MLFFLLHIAISFFNRFFFSFFPSIYRVYRWNWIFLLFHGGQSLSQLPSQSKDPHRCERKKYKRQGIKKKNSNSLYLCISASDLLSLSSSQPVILLFLPLFWPLFWGKKQIFDSFCQCCVKFQNSTYKQDLLSLAVIKIEIHMKWQLVIYWSPTLGCHFVPAGKMLVSVSSVLRVWDWLEFIVQCGAVMSQHTLTNPADFLLICKTLTSTP